MNIRKLFDSIKFGITFIGLSYLAGAFFTRGAMHALGIGW